MKDAKWWCVRIQARVSHWNHLEGPLVLRGLPAMGSRVMEVFDLRSHLPKWSSQSSLYKYQTSWFQVTHWWGNLVRQILTFLDIIISWEFVSFLRIIVRNSEVIRGASTQGHSPLQLLHRFLRIKTKTNPKVLQNKYRSSENTLRLKQSSRFSHKLCSRPRRNWIVHW